MKLNAMQSKNSFNAAAALRVGGREYQIFRLDALEKAGFRLDRIPYSIKVLLENLLRWEDGEVVRRDDIEYVARWEPRGPAQEIQFMPARVILHVREPLAVVETIGRVFGQRMLVCPGCPLCPGARTP